MVLSYFLLGVSTVALADSQQSSVLAWIGLFVAFSLFSIGSVLSGTTYLALIYDITPEKQRTRAVSVVWFFLITGFALAGILYGLFLPHYTRDGFLLLFFVAPLIMAVLWFVSLIGVEKPVSATASAAPIEHRPFLQDFRTVWSNAQIRVFFAFLALSTLCFYTQDSVLEPFAGQVFNMPPATTNRFSSYWGTMTLIGIIASLWLVRRVRRTDANTSVARWGVMILLGAFMLFFISAIAQIRPLVTIGLIVMGLGLGAWTVGTLGMMMDMTRAWGAGIYLAVWTVSETLARGLGVVLGGTLRDTALRLSGELPIAYGSVFLLEALGFAVSLIVLSRINVTAFRQQAPTTEAALSAAMN
jgi:MFS transporter, BCD family, chlorophyll transporter